MTTIHFVVLPGGAYSSHAPYEGEPIAARLRSMGFSASVFLYPFGPHPLPVQALWSEVRRIRERTDALVVVLGFSAGGHLAGLSVLADTFPPGGRPDGAVLCYPVVSMLEHTHEGSRTSLLGSGSTIADREGVSLELLVAADSPPLFVWHTVDDDVAPVQAVLLLAERAAAVRADVSVHIYPSGEHGLGLAEGSSAEGWLEELGRWAAAIRSAPVTGVISVDDSSPMSGLRPTRGSL